MPAGFICSNSDCRKWVTTQYDFSAKIYKEARCSICEANYSSKEVTKAVEETFSGRAARPNLDDKKFSTGKIFYQSIAWVWGSWLIAIVIIVLFIMLIYL